MTRPDPRLAAMRGDVPGCVWPPIHSGRQASLASTVLALDESQWFEPEELAARQLEQLGLLAAHCAQHSRQFAQRLKRAKLKPADLAPPGGLQRLTPLERRDLQVAPADVECAELPEGHRQTGVAATSGSTGEPVKVRRTIVSHVLWQAMTIRYHLWQEPDLSGRLAAIDAYVERPGVRPDWREPVSLLFRTGPALALGIEMDLDRQLDALVAFAPTSLKLFPANLGGLLETMARRGAALPSLERVRFVGGTASEELAARAAARLGAVTRDCYSSAEVGYVAIQCPASDLYHIMAEGLIVEIVRADGTPCADGELGRVLVTDLVNFATPLIRYAIGDWAIAGPDRCPCGRGLPVLRRIAGRDRNLVTHPDGMRRYPMVGYGKLRDAAPALRQFQLVQHAVDDLEFRVFADRPLTADDKAGLTAVLHGALLHPFPIRFTEHRQRLDTTRGHKFEEVVSLVGIPESR